MRPFNRSRLSLTSDTVVGSAAKGLRPGVVDQARTLKIILCSTGLARSLRKVSSRFHSSFADEL